MILIDKPFVSSLLEETLAELQIPVLKNRQAENFKLKSKLNYIKEEEAVDQVKNGDIKLLYSNSENSINWINNNLSFIELPIKIKLFKDKYAFRELIKPIYPDFFFNKININDIDVMDINNVKLPFIIKPTIGFFSMGIYVIETKEEWDEAKIALHKELELVKGLYPIEVMDASDFIIEEIIDGEEFAVDVYFNEKQKPVILNVYKHIFSSGKDVSDRAYFTSKTIIDKYHDKFNVVLIEIGKLAELKNFPMHIEFRVNKEGIAIPIEANPMRFAGWCMADMAYYAYGVNPYDYYFNQKEPNWDKILEDKQGKQYNVTIADISKDIKLSDIDYIDYERFTKDFKHPLDLRKMDYKTYPVFAFMFSETEETNTDEFDYFLKSNLKKYIIMK